jgi:hypothetical protein
MQGLPIKYEREATYYENRITFYRVRFLESWGPFEKGSYHRELAINYAKYEVETYDHEGKITGYAKYKCVPV